MTPLDARAAAAWAPVRPASAALAPPGLRARAYPLGLEETEEAGQREDGDVLLQPEAVVSAGDERRTLVFPERNQGVVAGIGRPDRWLLFRVRRQRRRAAHQPLGDVGRASSFSIRFRSFDGRALERHDDTCQKGTAQDSGILRTAAGPRQVNIGV
jgi:hypothetical protein